MARKPFIVGNWKLNKNVSEALSLVTELKNQASVLRQIDVGVAPVATAIHPVAKRLEESSIAVGGQNCYWETKGAFTGELSPSLLKDAGATFCIVGHSERRSLFGDSDEAVGKRALAALESGLAVIVCCGETLAERESGLTKSVVERQLNLALSSLPKDKAGDITIAYEPVWAIGTGKTATPAMAQEVHQSIRAQLKAIFGAESESMRIQYGGSVKPANAAELMAMPDIDGALVGGASLVSEDFIAICKAANAS